MTFQKPKGTVDFYPGEKSAQTKIFGILRATALKYNFKEVESPAFENLDLLSKKEGEEIKQQIFTLDKRGDESFGLRFDLTVPAARMFIGRQKAIQKPVKWFFLSRMWRYERPQQGRLREFYQLSVELYGSKNPEADAEIINLASDCLLNLGLKEDDFIIKVSNKNLAVALLNDFVPKEKMDETLAIIDKRSKIEPAEFEKLFKELKIDFKKITEILNLNSIEKIQKYIKGNKAAEEGFSSLKGTMKFLKAKSAKVDLSVVRGLVYYTGTVFEIFDKDQKYRALAGGGRYDQMVELFGGEPCPATGFAMGYATLSLLLQEKGLLQKAEDGPDYFIAIASEKAKEKAFEIASNLRKKYGVEIELVDRNLGKQFAYANSIGAKQVIVLGEKELKEGKATIKDMQSGKETRKGLKEIGL